MDIPSHSAFSTAGVSALPSAPLLHHEQIPGNQLLQYQKVQESISVQGLFIATGGKREISRQQWEEMKPLIQRVYIRENKTFRQLKNILQVEYGVEPTGHQFSRKVNEWGLKKNVSGSERRKILQGPPNRSRPLLETQYPRINSGKLQNWRKRYRKEESTLSVPRSAPENSSLLVNAIFGSKATDAQDSPLESSHQRSEFSTVQILPSSHMEFDIAMPALDPLESGDQWPFSWSTVNVPGSPGLSRLFAALELEESSPVPELSLSDTEVDTSQIVSVTELSDLFNEKNKGLVYDIDGAGCFQGHDATYNYRKFKRGQIPWRDLDQAFMGWSESALTKEVYVFPAPVTRNIPSLLSLRHGTMASLECKEAYLTDRLHKLEASILPNHGGVIATKEALAEVYESQYRLEEALDTYHEVYQQKRRIWGSSHFNSLSTRVSICRLLLCQCDLKIGLETVEDTISELDSIFGPEHELAVSAAVLKARFLTSLGKHNEAEKLDRQCLQIRLNNYGPKDEQTLESMKFLGISLAKQTHASGPQRLLQTTVQLYYEVPGTPEVFICDATMRLLWALGDLQLYEECHQLRHAALMRFEASLGSQHSLVLNIRLGLAWDLYEEGKFEESEREFRYMLALGFQSRNQRRIDTLLALNGLAHALGRLGHFEEAISCYEKTFQGFTGIFGPEDARSCYACDSLGRYYEQQNRAKDAVELYRKMIKMLQEGGFSDHTAIADCTRGIERLTSAADSEFLLLRA